MRIFWGPTGQVKEETSSFTASFRDSRSMWIQVPAVLGGCWGGTSRCWENSCPQTWEVGTQPGRALGPGTAQPHPEEQTRQLQNLLSWALGLQRGLPIGHGAVLTVQEFALLPVWPREDGIITIQL